MRDDGEFFRSTFNLTQVFILRSYFPECKILIQSNTYKFHIREERVLRKHLEELSNQILLRPGHSGTSSAVLIVFGPSIYWVCRYLFSTVGSSYVIISLVALTRPEHSCYRCCSLLPGKEFQCWIFFRKMSYMISLAYSLQQPFYAYFKVMIIDLNCFLFEILSCDYQKDRLHDFYYRCLFQLVVEEVTSHQLLFILTQVYWTWL